MPELIINKAKFNGISTLVFDLDNTLIPTREADKNTISECATWLEMHDLQIDESLEIGSRFNSIFRKDPCPSSVRSLEDLDTWRRDVWKSVLPKDFEEVDELYCFWKEERQRQLKLSLEVRKMLAKAKKMFEIGILTNGPSIAQWEKIDSCGIREYSNILVVSGDFKIEKPHKAIYDIVCDKMKVDPSECVMIGDRLDTDIIGAQNAEFGASVFVNYKNTPFGDWDVVPDFVVKNVTEVEELFSQF